MKKSILLFFYKIMLWIVQFLKSIVYIVFIIKVIMAVFRSLLIFILAGFCEIGGGYLVWLYMKNNKPLWYAILGGIILIVYGFIATYQPANFGRVYAAYGGIFIVMALMWAWKIDDFKPDKYDIIGAFIAFVGVCIIIYMPRK
ncbi:MAG TPA: YnfA family protein [Ferruginibacter sp.]|nr:YnfA family protein [Ferruginibacter sp.]